MSRKIPFQVSWLVDKRHVSDPYEAVARDIANRVDRLNTDTPRNERGRFITDAVIRHRRNRADYAWVMGHH